MTLNKIIPNPADDYISILANDQDIKIGGILKMFGQLFVRRTLN